MSDMPLEYASVLGDLIDSLRFQNVHQPLSRRTRHLLADLDRVTDGDVQRAISNSQARELESMRLARLHDANLRDRVRHGDYPLHQGGRMIETLILGSGAWQIHWLPTAAVPNPSEDWTGHNVTTLDNNPDHKPDIVWDLESCWHPYRSEETRGLPFEEDQFDEIHVYEVLEHTGNQGDYNFFFWQWSDFWRVLKPNGMFYGSVPLPTSPWAFGDPSHKRVIPAESFVFLDQQQYKDQVDTGKTPMSDFRGIYKADFTLTTGGVYDSSYFFGLKAIKPSRI